MKKFLRIMLAVSIIIMSLASIMGAVVSAEEVNAANAVASICTQYFASLNDAILAAEDGDTIMVHKDARITTAQISAKSVTIKGEGTTKPVITGSSPAFKLLDSGSLTLDNLSFTGFSNLIFCGVGESTVEDSYSVTLNSIDISFAASGVLYGYASTKIELTVTNSTFTSARAGQAVLNASIAPIQACYVKFENNTYNNGCVEIYGNSKGTVIDLDDITGDMMVGDTMAIQNGAVARIGETASGNMGEVYYKDLAVAVSMAQDGDTIYILSNIQDFNGATYSNKTLKFVSANKYTITPSSAANFAFTVNDGADIIVENLKFEGYTGKNFIVFSNAAASGGAYNITVKDTDVSFRATGAIYGYFCEEATINIENCSFNASAAGDCILNFTNNSCYQLCELNLKDVTLNQNCGIAAPLAEHATVNETFTSDAKAIQRNMRLRVGATEGGKVGEVYFSTIESETLKALPTGTKLTVLCTCGEKQEITSLTCETKVTCTCGEEIDKLTAHDYTEATCQKKATCNWCQAEKGRLAEHDYSAATCTAKAKCKTCGIEPVELLKHRDIDSNGKCDFCNLNMNGNASTGTGSVNSGDKNNADSDSDNKTEEKKGCGSTVTVAGLALVAVLGSCAIFVEKRR